MLLLMRVIIRQWLFCWEENSSTDIGDPFGKGFYELRSFFNLLNQTSEIPINSAMYFAGIS